MTFIAFIACLSLACILTALVVSYAAGTETGTSVSFVLLVIWFIVAIGFQSGAKWQRAQFEASQLSTKH